METAGRLRWADDFVSIEYPRQSAKVKHDGDKNFVSTSDVPLERASQGNASGSPLQRRRPVAGDHGFARARLQPCSGNASKSWASAPEGSTFQTCIPSAAKANFAGTAPIQAAPFQSDETQSFREVLGSLRSPALLVSLRAPPGRAPASGPGFSAGCFSASSTPSARRRSHRHHPSGQQKPRRGSQGDRRA
jgi:hypothetical protein